MAFGHGCPLYQSPSVFDNVGMHGITIFYWDRPNEMAIVAPLWQMLRDGGVCCASRQAGKQMWPGLQRPVLKHHRRLALPSAAYQTKVQHTRWSWVGFQVARKWYVVH